MQITDEITKLHILRAIDKVVETTVVIKSIEQDEGFCDPCELDDEGQEAVEFYRMHFLDSYEEQDRAVAVLREVIEGYIRQEVRDLLS